MRTDTTETEATGTAGPTGTGDLLQGAGSGPELGERKWRTADERRFWEAAFLAVLPVFAGREDTATSLDATLAAEEADAALAQRRAWDCAHLRSTGFAEGWASCDDCGEPVELRGPQP